MSRYDKEDAARDTGSTSREVSQAWHEAREDDDSLVERVVSKTIEGGVGALRKLFGLDDDKEDD